MIFNDPAIPALDLLHPVLVDEAGNRVSGPSRAGLFAARDSVPFYFDKAASIRAFPKGLEASERQAGVQTLRLAIRNISQVDIGADLLVYGFRRKIKVRLDGSRLRQIGAGAQYRETSKTVIVNEAQTVADMTLSLVHEFEHAAHCVDGLVSDTANDSVATSLVKSRIRECAARTIVGVFTYQAESNNGGPGHYQVKSLKEAFAKTDPVLAQEAKKHARLAEQGDWQAFGGELFQSCLKDMWTLGYHDNIHILAGLELVDISIKRHLKAALGDISDPALMSRSLPPIDRLASQIRLLGKAYVPSKLLGSRRMKQLTPLPKLLENYDIFKAKARYLNAAGFDIRIDIPEPDFRLCARYDYFTRQLVKKQELGTEQDLSASDLTMSVGYIGAKVKRKLGLQS